MVTENNSTQSNVAEKNKTIDTGDGEDKVSLNEGELSYLTINTGAGNDIVEIQNNSHTLLKQLATR